MSSNKMESTQIGDKNVRHDHTSRGSYTETATSNAILTTTGRYGFISMSLYADDTSMYFLVILLIIVQLFDDVDSDDAVTITPHVFILSPAALRT